jgi:hypothetical protein
LRVRTSSSATEEDFPAFKARASTEGKEFHIGRNALMSLFTSSEYFTSEGAAFLNICG